MKLKIAAIALFIFACQAHAVIELPPLISDRMVLQAGTEVPIWGKAEPKEKIKVSFRGKTLSVVADASGDWKIVLPKMERDTLESKGSELVISAGGETKRVRDVLVGEVWLGAGQSNMHTPLNEYWTDPATPALKDGKFPSLRLRKMDQLHQKENWGWWAATDWRNGAFSAQLIGFGVRLMKHFNCPVGLIEAGSNGSPSGPFLSKEGFLASGEIARMIEKNPNLAKYADKVGWHWRGMIKPCVPFAVKGIYWDQGEGGTEMPEIYQPVVMRAIVASWRKAWGRDLPWIYVQKPSGGGCALDPENPFNKGSKACEALPENVPGGSWHASLRGDGYDIARMSGVYLLVNSDLSPGVHPPIKSSYAERGFRIALANVYGEKVEWTGPMFVKVVRKGGKVAVLFDHTAEGLCVPKGTELQGFALAGADGKWAWAKGEIKGKNRVVLSVPAGMNPVRIRYATQWPCAWANLFNSEGFPALGFESEIK
jgi:sialate O-acetylesterase